MLVKVGTTDERDVCECCGKTGLKKVIVLRELDGGDFRYYGSECATVALLIQAYGSKGYETLCGPLPRHFRGDSELQAEVDALPVRLRRYEYEGRS